MTPSSLSLIQAMTEKMPMSTSVSTTLCVVTQLTMQPHKRIVPSIAASLSDRAILNSNTNRLDIWTSIKTMTTKIERIQISVLS